MNIPAVFYRGQSKQYTCEKISQIRIIQTLRVPEGELFCNYRITLFCGFNKKITKKNEQMKF